MQARYHNATTKSSLSLFNPSFNGILQLKQPEPDNTDNCHSLSNLLKPEQNIESYL